MAITTELVGSLGGGWTTSLLGRGRISRFRLGGGKQSSSNRGKLPSRCKTRSASRSLSLCLSASSSPLGGGVNAHHH